MKATRSVWGLAAATVLVWLCLFATIPGSAGAAPNIPSYARGLLTVTGTTTCGLGYTTCTTFRISSCANQPTGTNAPAGTIADDLASPDVVNPKGMVVFFSGDEGLFYWGDAASNADPSVLHQLRQAGYFTVQVKWSTTTPPSSVTSWLQAKAPLGQSKGADDMGCKPATVIQYIWDVLYQSRQWPPHGVGQCGFCLTGNSGGASQAAISLALYTFINGLAVDAFLPSSGPIHTAIDLGCTAGSPYEFLNSAARGWIDASYGWQLGAPTPANCQNEDGSGGWSTPWHNDSLDYLITTGGFGFPAMRVEITTGGADSINTRRHPCLFYTTLLALGTMSELKYSIIAGMPHHIQDSKDGVDALVRAIQNLPGNPEQGCPPA
jgi:hypothetical protein